MALDIEHDVPLGPRTTLKIGGRARRLVVAWNADEVREGLALAQEAGEPVLVLGGGSNLVVSDLGWPGLVIAIDIRGVAITGYTDRGTFSVVSVGAGVVWDAFVAQMVEAGLRVPVGHPRSGRCDPDAERRRLRAGGR
jgi:UDP-N-acetylmuramate dehydrogenase